MRQKKHVNAEKALEASKDAEPGSVWNGDWCGGLDGIDCKRCYADKVCWQYRDTAHRRAALQSGLDAYHKRKAEKAEREAESSTLTEVHDLDDITSPPAPLIPDPPDTPEVRKIMEHLAQDVFLMTGCTYFDGIKCDDCPLVGKTECNKTDREARYDFAVGWLSRHAPAVWDATKGPRR